MKNIFTSQTYGEQLSLKETLRIIEKIILENNKDNFVLAIGTDSQSEAAPS